MAQQTINVGTNPNDGTGDPLRTGFVKTNSNFTELYSNKQNTLVSGTNIKTINGETLLGSGDIETGSVTEVSALTLGTSGSDLSSTIANGTTTPQITLNVPSASTTSRGVLTSADWSTFNAKQDDLFLFQTKNGSFYFNDFIGRYLDSQLYFANGTGAGISYQGTAPNNKTIGEIYMTTGTNSTTYAELIIGGTGSGNGGHMYLGNGVFQVSTRVQIPTFSTATDTFALRIGPMGFFNAFLGSPGYSFVYDPQNSANYGITNGNWWLQSGGTFGTIFTDSGVAVTNSYFKLSMIVNASNTQIEFYINDVLVGTHTNTYTGVLCPILVGIKKAAGTQSRQLNVDYVGYNYKFTSLR